MTMTPDQKDRIYEITVLVETGKINSYEAYVEILSLLGEDTEDK